MTSVSNGLAEEVDLAHAPGFRLGPVIVHPSLRQLVREDDGSEEIVEPRIMQVLVALARAEGRIVTRDDLVRDCWGGRAVSEDAINRAISRIRRLAEGIGKDAFQLDTVTKVGYRLRRLSGDGLGETLQAPSEPSAGRKLTRRHWIAGGAALIGLSAGGVALMRNRPASTGVPPDIAALMDQATIALSQQTHEGQNQSIGLYRRVVAQSPDYADGWGSLAYAYACTAPYRQSAEGEALRSRARAAAQRALSLQPGNPLAKVALAIARPWLGNWLTIERGLREALIWHPDQAQLIFVLSNVLAAVGRFAEALPLADRVATLLPPSPGLYFVRMRALWALQRMEEFDRLSEEAASLYPTQFSLWFTRFYVALFSGRPGTAIALGSDLGQRPTGIPPQEFESIMRVARVVQQPDAKTIDIVTAEQMQRAHAGSGYAENALQFACCLGRVDTAFAIAEAYYFDRGFTVPEVRFTTEQGTYLPRRDRLTLILFTPVTAPMRADRRFAGLVTDLGLEHYWRESGSRPDYRA